jgi:hypothetical protein
MESLTMLSHKHFSILYLMGNDTWSTDELLQAMEPVYVPASRNCLYMLMRRFKDEGLVHVTKKPEKSRSKGSREVTSPHNYYCLSDDGTRSLNEQIEFYQELTPLAEE